MAQIKHAPLKFSRNIFFVSSVQCNPVAGSFPSPRTEVLNAFKHSQPYSAKQRIDSVGDCIIWPALLPSQVMLREAAC